MGPMMRRPYALARVSIWTETQERVTLQDKPGHTSRHKLMSRNMSCGTGMATSTCAAIALSLPGYHECATPKNGGDPMRACG